MKAKAIWLTVMGLSFLASLAALVIVSANTVTFPLESFLTSLQRGGYEVQTDMGSSELLRGRVTQITLTDGGEKQTLLLYQYPKEERAQANAACISPSGSLFTYPEENGMERSVTVEWTDAPHFYLHRNAIVQYVGSDEELLALLEGLFGPPFAGEGSGDTADGSHELTLE